MDKSGIPITKHTYVFSDELKTELEKQTESEQKEKFVLHTLVDCLEYFQLEALMYLKYKKDEAEYKEHINRLYDWCVTFREIEKESKD